MKGIVEERAVELAEYIVENKTTVRAAAKQFGVSKSTVHMDVARRLRSLNPQLYSEVREILDINKAQRHIRGGLATREVQKHERRKQMTNYVKFIAFFCLLWYVFIHNHNRHCFCQKGELKCRRKKRVERKPR